MDKRLSVTREGNLCGVVGIFLGGDLEHRRNHALCARIDTCLRAHVLACVRVHMVMATLIHLQTGYTRSPRWTTKHTLTNHIRTHAHTYTTHSLRVLLKEGTRRTIIIDSRPDHLRASLRQTQARVRGPLKAETRARQRVQG